MKIIQKVRRLFLVCLVPFMLLVFGLSLWLIIASHVRERRAWEERVSNSLELVANSTLIRTYAEYRSFGLSLEANVYLEYIRDNLLLLVRSFSEGEGQEPFMYFSDERSGVFWGIHGGRGFDPAPEEQRLLQIHIAEVPPGGIYRPLPFGKDGGYRFSRATEFADRPILLYMELPDPFERTVVSLMIGIIVFSIAFGALLVLVNLLIRRAIARITDPIERLTAVAERVLAEDLEVRALHESDDEIGELADAFNNMLDRLSRLIFERTKILESIGDGFLALDAEGRLTYVNTEARRILGTGRQDLIGRTMGEAFPAAINVETLCRDVAVRRSAVELESFYLGQELGAERWLAMKANPVEEGGISVYISDITARKSAEEALKESLRQKEFLLREVHHRVKNNLQVVASLFEFQQSVRGRRGDPGFGKAFADRIRAMCEIYECLSESSDFSRIDFYDYASSLVSYLYQSYRPFFGDVHVEVIGGRVGLDIGFAFPCGLILNELVANAFRHAFPAELGRPGRLAVGLQELADASYELRIEDDGCGLPEGLGPGKSGGVGFALVSLLVSQLGGDMLLDRSGGTRFVIRFGAAAR